MFYLNNLNNPHNYGYYLFSSPIDNEEDVITITPSATTESSSITTGHRDLCANWTSAKEAANQECTTDAHTTVKCYGGMTNINMSLPPMEDTAKLILCGWPSNNFDAPAVLKHFPNLESLHIEHSDTLTYFEKDFPSELLNLKVNSTVIFSVY